MNELDSPDTHCNRVITELNLFDWQLHSCHTGFLKFLTSLDLQIYEMLKHDYKATVG
jgi:hypothetical protein